MSRLAATPGHRQWRPVDRLDELVVLVDAADRPVGTMDKLAAHRRGLRHRAVSVMIRDHEGRLMLQRRHPEKYHSAGLWANACCGHPRPDEDTGRAAARRLSEEMGLSCPLTLMFRTEYRAGLADGLTEHEVVHVFAGAFDGDPRPDPDEVDGWRWLTPDALRDSVARNPEQYAIWFRMYVRDHWPSVVANATPMRRGARTVVTSAGA